MTFLNSYIVSILTRLANLLDNVSPILPATIQIKWTRRMVLGQILLLDSYSAILLLLLVGGVSRAIDCFNTIYLDAKVEPVGMVKARIRISRHTHEIGNILCSYTIYYWSIYLLGSSRPCSSTSVDAERAGESDHNNISHNHGARCRIRPFTAERFNGPNWG